MSNEPLSSSPLLPLCLPALSSPFIRLYSVFSIHTNVVSFHHPLNSHPTQQQERNIPHDEIKKSSQFILWWFRKIKEEWELNDLDKKIKERRGKSHPSHSYNFLCALCWRWTLIFISLLPLARFTASFSPSFTSCFFIVLFQS